MDSWGKTFGQEMRVEVAAEEQELKDEEIGGPDSGGAAEPREDVFADDELDLKEEKGAEEDGDGEEPDGGGGIREGGLFGCGGRDCGV